MDELGYLGECVKLLTAGHSGYPRTSDDGFPSACRSHALTGKALKGNCQKDFYVALDLTIIRLILR